MGDDSTLLEISNTNESMEVESTSDSVSWYFSGENGTNSNIFLNHPWPIYLIFVVQFVGVVLNSLLVSYCCLLKVLLVSCTKYYND